MNHVERREAVERFYHLLGELESVCGDKRRLADCSRQMEWPKRGVYFFFEDGETREDGVNQRVVRVGTHALRPSKSTLWGRLSQHRGSVGGSMPGGGSHRGSVFRLHVGSALLRTGDWSEEIRGSWAKGGSAEAAIRSVEYPLERAVSEYIRAMPFLWLEVADEPAAASDRGVIEAGAISLLSNFGREPVDPPSPNWLGLEAERAQIRSSGLWNVNHVADPPRATFLTAMERWIDRTGSMDTSSRLL